MNDHAFFQRNNLAISVVWAVALLPTTFALAGPEPCITVGATVTCEGDQSAGIDRTAPPNQLNVLRLDRRIEPLVNVPGIRLISNGGGNAFINSGESQQAVGIETHGANASGIIGSAQGVPSGIPPDDAFLNIPLLGINPAVGGGEVRINSYSNIVTHGSNAHALQAYSSSPGYPDAVLNKLRDFSESGFGFAVTEVRDASEAVVAFSGASVQLRGHLIDADGAVITDGKGDPILHGTFTLHQDGHFEVQFSADELAAHGALTQAQSLSVAVNYTVQGRRATTTQDDDGKLVITVLRNTEGDLVQTREAWFDSFGVSGKPAADTSPTLFPDLKRYVTGLLNDAEAGGAGNSVSIVSNGRLETKGAQSHGIHAYSQGGQGTRGRDGSIRRSAGAGGAGEAPGEVDVVADGLIITHLANSSGIAAVSAGGAGGAGGDGGVWRHGQKGGTGGTGGLVSVGGSAEIRTAGNYSSGIIALSVGGNGGAGGSGSGAMPGGGGGFGGKGGRVIVDGGWDVTTTGNWAHGIWAKSLGGNAGNGGSGGWLFGDPGRGGTATDGGKVSLRSSGAIQTSGLASYGLYAQSVGGFGGSGGTSWGLFWSFGGSGDSGGSGGEVELFNLAGGSVKTNNLRSHGVLAQSIGGGGGSGGGEFAVFASLGGSGGAGGNGGKVTVENDGAIQTGNSISAENKGDFSHGILAQSIGGGGGDGGSVSGLVGIGGKGSQTSDGGEVNVINRGSIDTYGIQSHAIFAQSIGGGGGDGGRSTGLVAIGGDGGAGGDAGIVKVTNEGALHTRKEESHGVFAQSIGGGGGSGGGAISSFGNIAVSIGGSGGTGGDGKDVEVYGGAASSIVTDGVRSHAVFAQSIGGGGGNGGFAISAGSGFGVRVAIGGAAGAGGDAGNVRVLAGGSIDTNAGQSYGVFAQSIGGGGGTGGFSIAGSYGGSGLNLGLGGRGGSGGIGANVDVGTLIDPIFGTIHTRGLNAHGVVAQSIGGSGGDGGFSIAGSIGGGINANISIGGDGGTGNHAGEVAVQSISTITTEKNDSHAILAQSIGGSGGSGGFSISASLLGGASLNLGFGGDGGSGSYAKAVKLGSAAAGIAGTLTTHGERSHGIVAQSIGGGGGAGGASITGSLLNPAAIGLAFGGDGGSGGLGGTVDVYADGDIVTHGRQSHGILAQSIGGGGGAGGLSISGSVTAFGGLSLAMGGDGGIGNTANTVKVSNTGNIETREEYAYGIVAQSIGGGGGTGGSSGAVMANFSSLIPIPEPYPTGSVNIAIALGGDGGKGGAAGRVEVINDGWITTRKDYAYGVLAQSIGGGGGDGGKSIAATANISMPSGPSDGEPQLEVKVDFAMAIGGKGASGNLGNEVVVTNRNMIDTSGVGAHGIFAQSIGGGGGAGGDARSMILSIDPSNWNSMQPELPDPASISVGATLSIGGSAGTGEDAGSVRIDNTRSIVTRGADAFGILAQSIGGGGGLGGSGYHGLDWQDFGVPEELEPFLDLLPVQDEGDLHITVGGSGANSGDGKAVSVDSKSSGSITTEGAGSIAVMAQSIGGGGGIGGIGAVGGDGSIGLGGRGGAAGNGGRVDVLIDGNISTAGVVAHGILAQSIGGGGGYAGNIDRGISDFGFNFALGGAGGNAGNGDEILVVTKGSINTGGTGAVGILAQSIGGGGGLGGGVGFGFGFAGSVGGRGSGGAVIVSNEGSIHTAGTAAHGIVAQSIGGMSGGEYGGLGGAVVVNSSGNIGIAGVDAHGIVAQSVGIAGNGNVTVNVNGGTISGGSGSGSGIYLLNGASNTVTNRGAVSALSGRAIVGGSEAEIVNNYGTLSGNVELGAGNNSFNNYSGAQFNSLATIAVGAGRPFSNSGTLSPGGTGNVQVTTLTGNLLQGGTGMLALDLSLAGLASDRLNVAGSAQLGGGLRLNPVDTGYVRTGTQASVVLSASGGVVADGLLLNAPTSSIVHYALSYPSANEISVSTSVNFAPAALGPNAQRIGAHLNAIQAAGGSASLAPYVSSLIGLSDDASLAAAYEKLGTGALGSLTSQSTTSSLDFNNAMHSCRQRDGDFRFIREGECNWVRFGGSSRDQQRTDLNAGYKLDAQTIAGGLQREIKADMHFGFGLSYQRSDLNSIFSDVNGDRFEAGLMLKRRFGATRISGSLSVGQGRYDSRRLVDITTPGVRALALQELWSASLHGRVSHDLVSGDDAYVRPMLSMGITHVSRNGYTESGAGGANLQVAKERDTFVSLHPAIEFGSERKWGGDGTLLRQYLRLGLTHFLGNNDRHITASLQGAPAGVAPFTAVTKADRTYADLSLGVDILKKSGATVRLDYTGQFSKNSSTNAVWVKFSLPF